MNEATFRQVFAQFLNDYWGAFHEALEAQSVTPKRLAGSLFTAIVAQHRIFAATYSGEAEHAVAALARIWREIEARRYQFADPPLTRDEATKARALFAELFESLNAAGARFATARREILAAAAHGTPAEPLRADVAR